MFAPEAAFSARDRLLPASVPFRFFGTALVFHLFAWILILIGEDSVTGFVGGPGTILAALHLVTLGVLLMTAMGASFQILPMATVRPVRSIGLAKACYWLLTPGTLVLAYGMATLGGTALAIGGGLVGLAVALFAGLLIDNARGVGEMPVAALSVRVALASLAGMALIGLALVWDFGQGVLGDRAAWVGLHFVLAVFGFMGMLAAGLSTVLVPMLALTPAPSVSWGRSAAEIAAAALLLAAVATVTGEQTLLVAAAAAGLMGTLIHVRTLTQALRQRMRRRLGLSFALIRASWTMLAAALLLGLALALGVDVHGLSTIFGIVAVLGWLLTFLFGVLQRIAPFLASVHATAPGRPPPLVSKLAPETPLKAHAASHVVAVALLVGGTVFENDVTARIGAGFGCVGAIALIIFAINLYARTRVLTRSNGGSPSGDIACST